MKRTFLCLLVSVFAAISLVSLSSCSGGIKGDEAKVWINDFFVAIEAEDYEKAEGYLHSERPGDLKTFFLNIEEDAKVDFQSGVEIVRYAGVSIAYYDSSVGGSTYELTMDAKVGETDMEIVVELVKNENGFGIYNLDLRA